MKATGIVRRIDDLGRIVIPKEIRRTLRIRESDPLEILSSRNILQSVKWGHSRNSTRRVWRRCPDMWR